jgi:hypothetical protein
MYQKGNIHNENEGAENLTAANNFNGLPHLVPLSVAF